MIRAGIPGRRVLLLVLPGILGAGLLVSGSPWWRQDLDRAWVYRRFWSEVHVGLGYLLHGEFPVVTARPDTPPEPAAGERFRREILFATWGARIAPWQFWRTLPAGSFVHRSRIEVFDRFDDSGRGFLTALGFRLLGGVSPSLPVWLGLLLGAPLAAWLCAELAAAGRPVAAFVMALLVGTSAFLVEAVTLAYSAVGFHVLALLALASLALHAALSPSVSPRSLVGRAAAAGLAFAVCGLCRSSVVLVLPGALLVLGIAGRRLDTARRGFAAWPTLLTATALLIVPYAVLKTAQDRLVARTLARHGTPGITPQRHVLWFSLAAGLGDFDRTKGYVWRDEAVSAILIAAGGTAFDADLAYDPRNEEILRLKVTGDVAGDPAWYGGILLKRLVATVVQWKLWPWAPPGGYGFRPRTHPAEGAVDDYYRLTATADLFGVAGRRVEAPVPFLLLPTVALAAAALLAAAPFRSSRRREVAALAGVAAGALAVPVAITTGSAVETQGFMLVYFLGTALAADAAVAWAKSRSSAVP